MDRRPLDVLVVSYGRPDLLDRCLRSVRTHLPKARVRVWDNRSASTSGIRRLSAGHPDVEWVFSDVNVGFAAAVNELAAASDADTLLLNPDAELTGPLARCRAVAAEPGVAAVSPLVVEPEGRARPWDVGHRRQTPLRILLNHAGYADRLRGTSLSDLYAEPPEEVDGYLTGCCLFVPRAAWTELGPFDARFFLYAEESEWQQRALDRGWRLRLVTTEEVRHVGAATSGDHSQSRMRALDLLNANTALAARLRLGPLAGATVQAGQFVLSRIQRSKRRVRVAAARDAAAATDGRCQVVITYPARGAGDPPSGRVQLANDMSARGFPVTVVAHDELGTLPRVLDPGVRLALRPWWLPTVDRVGAHAVLISGRTPRELMFGLGWRRLGISRGRRWITRDAA